ncbi:hypothetical protein GCM10008941_29610 [Rhizomicrobium palustre]
MDGVWLAGIALTALSSGHGSLDNNMVMSPGPDQSAIREACSDFEHNAERSGWGRLQPVGALPSGKIERLVILRIDGCPAREVVKRGAVYLIQGGETYLTSSSSGSGKAANPQ